MEKCPVERSEAKCPVNHNAASYWQHQAKIPLANGLSPDITHHVTSDPSLQSVDPETGLATARVISSIPRDATDETQKWHYPSEAMFYRAMQRKGHSPRPEDMQVIVPMHNIVNEQCWQKVCRWEGLYHDETKPRLVRFLGRPKDFTPRAWFYYLVLGKRPFDRHDWFVADSQQRIRRYVIDFYEGDENALVRMDVRPAFDSFEALRMRFKAAWRKWTGFD